MLTVLYVMVVVPSSLYLWALQCLVSTFEGTMNYAEMRSEWPGKPCLPFNRHAGLLLDAFLVTPLWILFAMYYLDDLDLQKVGMAMLVGLAVSVPIHLWWKKSSRNSCDPCYQLNTVSTTGWIHFGYMIQHIGATLAFYFVAYPRKVEVLVVTLLLMIYVSFGMLQPEVWMQKERTGRWKVGGGVWIAYLVVVGILTAIARYTRLHNSRP